MTDNKAVVQVFDGGQISPTLQSVEISIICNPLLVGSCGCKVTVEQVRILVIGADFFQLLVHFGFSSNRTDVEFAHQPQNSLVIDDNPLLLLKMQSNTTIALGSV